jgi:hypothetical protein
MRTAIAEKTQAADGFALYRVSEMRVSITADARLQQPMTTSARS